MIILKETNVAQTIKFIGRYTDCDTIVLKDESTKTETSLSVTCTLDRYYLVTTNVFSLKEGRTYMMTAYYNGNICFIDKIYCTNQIISKHSINKDEYGILNDRIDAEGGTIETSQCLVDNIDNDEFISKESNNDYIII